MLSGMSRAEQALELVDELDLERYQGTWYEIARLPNRFQSDCAGAVSAHYQLRADGRVDVTNRCRRTDGGWIEAQGVARRADDDGSPAALEVRFAPHWLSFLPFVWGDYRVIALGEDYDHALVGSEDREFLWVLARERELPQATFDRLIERARSQGFDTDQLVRTQQSP
ncbi:lipocalin family protein [Wenzhouxiangella sp. XN201]|nr:lipocalin family protein [Wenzhouxiangella sp. XN201]